MMKKEKKRKMKMTHTPQLLRFILVLPLMCLFSQIILVGFVATRNFGTSLKMVSCGKSNETPRPLLSHCFVYSRAVFLPKACSKTTKAPTGCRSFLQFAGFFKNF